jgi:16S rRNA (guanine527-N7)-methyltransferase
MEEAPHGMEIVTRYFTDFTAEQLRQLTALEGLYRHWNEQINVISRKDIGSLYEKHVLHSLSLAALFSFPPGSRIIDIGTGGGFPGIPLAIFFPQARFHLVDSIGKKLIVVKAVAESLGLHNVSTQQIRAEAIRDTRFDAVVSRAVAPLKDLWRWSKPLLKKPAAGTVHSDDAAPPAAGLICLKGGELAAEIADSGTRPRIFDIHEIFPEAAFKDKYVLQITR